MKRLLTSLFLAFGFLITSAQIENTEKIDSLISGASYQTAIELINSRLANDPSETNSILLKNKKAQALISLGNIAVAELILDNIKTSDQILNAITLSNKGFLNLVKGRYDITIDALKSSQNLFKSANQENSKEGIRCLANLASYYVAVGKYNQAEEYELIVLQQCKIIYGENSEEVASSYNNLGLIYLTTDPDKALDYYEKALNTYQKIYSDNNPKIAIANTNLGMSYVQIELYGDAINYFESARKVWEKIYPNGHPNLAFVLRNLGRAYAKQKNTKSAIEFYEKSISMYRQAYGGKHSDIASSLNELASLQLGMNEYDLAMKALQESLIANAPHFNSANINNNPLKTDYYNPYVFLNSLKLKSKILEEKYLAKTLKLDDLRQALQCLTLCNSLIDDIRFHSSDEGDKLALGGNATVVYEDGVRIALTISENVLKPKSYLEKAFYFAEKSKSAVLQESIADTQAKSFAGIPPTLLEEEKNIKSTISFLTQKLSQKPSSEEEIKIREQLFQQNIKSQEFTAQLEKSYPNYFNLKYGKKSYTVLDLQKTIDNKTAILSYFIAEESKKVHVFIITKTRFYVNTSSLPANFDRLIRGFTNSLLYSEPQTFRKSVNSLSGLLIPRLPSAVSELIIIPSGSLSTLPFEALVTKENKKPEFISAKYLIEKYAISYEFSAALLLNKKENDSQEPSIYLCAPIQFSSNPNLAELPGTEKEVNAIAALFGKRSSYSLRNQANETVIKSDLLSNYQYLHFATHGIVDQENPESSQLFLNASEKEDGNLYAGEIYSLNLNAKLAVLSACQTGLGKVSKGEGVIGLSRALVYAGAQNIIVSFWSVADESTSQLMTDFYDFLLKSKNQNFKLALRQSKFKMIRDGKHSAPYYWAPFILIGK